MTLSRKWIGVAAFLGMLAVALGAFAGHGLEHRLSASALATFKTANQYHFYHVGALFFALLSGVCFKLNQRAVHVAVIGFAAGIILFSGSLYLLALTGERLFAFITPVGGVVWIGAWAALALSSVLKRGEACK